MGRISTSQRTAAFYLAWFFRCFYATEAGWVISRTPDDRAIMHQDAFFWRALEIVCGVMNEKMREDLAKAGNR